MNFNLTIHAHVNVFTEKKGNNWMIKMNKEIFFIATHSQEYIKIQAVWLMLWHTHKPRF